MFRRSNPGASGKALCDRVGIATSRIGASRDDNYGLQLVKSRDLAETAQA
jgi:hypothetical protein